MTFTRLPSGIMNLATVKGQSNLHFLTPYVAQFGGMNHLCRPNLRSRTLDRPTDQQTSPPLLALTFLSLLSLSFFPIRFRSPSLPRSVPLFKRLFLLLFCNLDLLWYCSRGREPERLSPKERRDSYCTSPPLPLPAIFLPWNFLNPDRPWREGISLL